MPSLRVNVAGNRRLAESIHALEDKIDRKISLLSKILLSDTGVLEDKLHIILDTAPSIQVIEQTYSKQLIFRRSYVIDSISKRKLVYAQSKIHVDCLPMAIIAQIRNKKAGLGRILIDSRLEIHKEIITIGYDYRKRGLFRSYNIYNKKRAVIE